MSGVNKVILVGNLGRDPEVRFSGSGTAVCNLSVAVSERTKTADGYADKTEWFRVVAFGKTAENAGNYLAKGRKLYVEGRLQTSTYKDKEGNDRHRVEVVASQLVFLGGGDKGAASKPADEPAEDLPF